MNQDLINNLPDILWDSFLKKSNGGNTPIKYLYKILRLFDDDVEQIFYNGKIPVSNSLYQKYGVKFYGNEYFNIPTHKEHIIEVEKRVKKAITLIKRRGYTKEKLYQWLIDTLYLVYKSREEHNESLNGGKTAENECLPIEFHEPDKWKIFDI